MSRRAGYLALLVYTVVFLVAWAVLTSFVGPGLIGFGAAILLALLGVWLISPEARLFLARRMGRTYDVLKASNPISRRGYDEARKTLSQIAPTHPTSGLLLKAHADLRNLEIHGNWAKTDGVPEQVGLRFVDQAKISRDALWRCADRVARLSRLRPVPAAALDREAEQLGRLVSAAKSARLALAELTVQVLRGNLDEAGQTAIADGVLAELGEVSRQIADGGGR
jgi:hypothetical protein